MISFETSVYKSSRAFCIHKLERNKLGIGDGDSVHLIVRAPSGAILYQGRKTLRSGAEIYGKDIAPVLTPGSRIQVEASQPITVFRNPNPSEEPAIGDLSEGNRRNRVLIHVNRFERSRKARRECVRIFGSTCQVCGFDFGRFYGKRGEGFIHVHHLKPVSEIGKTYKVDPKTDLRPVCPNCHEMLHSGPNSPISIEELRAIIAAQS